MKKIFILFFSVITILPLLGQSNTWQWAETDKQPHRRAYAQGFCVTTDLCGNVYTAGGYGDSIAFGASTLYSPSNANGNQQIYLVKYDATGNVLWAVSGTGTQNQWPESIATDNNGNVYVTGQFQSPALIFGHDTLYQTPNSIPNNANDGFVVKFNAEGNVLWARKFGGNWWDALGGLVADALGNLYIVGWFRSNSVDFGTYTFQDGTHENANNTVLIKCDSAANVIWAKNISWCWVSAITLDNKGDVLFDGGFWGSDSVKFGPNTVFSLDNVISGTLQDFYIAKYDTGGTPLWANNTGITGINADVCTRISTDVLGNAYIAGGFTSDSVVLGNTTLHGDSAGDSYFFVEKYAANGQLVWARGGTSPAFAEALGTDTDNNTYVTGTFNAPEILIGNTVLHNPDSATSGSHIFLSKYDVTGNALWAMALGGDSDDYVYDLALDPGGNVYLAGWFSSDSIAFGPNVLHNAGDHGSNPFVAGFNSGKAPFYLSVPQTTICAGDTIQICANAGFISYQWSNGDSGTCIKTAYAGNYEVTVQSALNYCPVTSGQVNISQYPPSPVTVSVIGGDTISCYAAETYQWYYNGNAIPGDTSQVLIARQNGNYEVKITDANGCPAVSSDIPIIGSGVNDIANEDALIKLYPNPTTDLIYIKTEDIQPQTTSIYDVNGQLVSTMRFAPQVDVSILAPGVYLIKVSAREGMARRMFVKM